MVASRHIWGGSPLLKEMLKSWASDDETSWDTSFSRRVGMSSLPGLLVVSSARRSFSTSSDVVCMLDRKPEDTRGM